MNHQLQAHLVSLITQFKESHQFRLSLISFSLGISGLLLGTFLIIKPPAAAVPYQNSNTNPKSGSAKVAGESVSQASSSGQIVVDVAGAVAKPGVYESAHDSRIFNALEKAGGLTAAADLAAIHQQLNLAEKLSEGEKVYFPVIQKNPDSSSSQSPEISGLNKLISINLASAAELDTLPGIGEKLATKIIEGRPYLTVDELVTRIKIGQSVFDKLKARIKI